MLANCQLAEMSGAGDSSAARSRLDFDMGEWLLPTDKGICLRKHLLATALLLKTFYQDNSLRNRKPL
jgi:hypothetical protein